MFTYDEKRHRALLDDENADCEIVGKWSDADEMHRAISEGDETREDGPGFIKAEQGHTLSVYPLSLSEPEPQLVVTVPGVGPVIVGRVSWPSDEQAEHMSQADETVFVVREAVEDANAWLASRTDAGSEPDECPNCGSEAICEQTRADQAPWACLDCSHEFDGPRQPEPMGF